MNPEDFDAEFHIARQSIGYQFCRESIKRGDIGSFLILFGQDRLPRGPRLRALLGSMFFEISGFENDPRALYLIPEVRVFYQQLHRLWPFCLYFFDLDTDTLHTMTLSCLPVVNGNKLEGKEGFQTCFEQQALLSFLNRAVIPMQSLCFSAKMADQEIHARMAAVFQYWGLSIKFPPPPKEEP